MSARPSAQPGFAALFRAAFALIGRQREAALLVTGLFLFLPMLALLVFMPPPQFDGATDAEAVKAFTDYAQASYPAMLAMTLPMAFGSAALLAILLGVGKPTVGGHLAHAGKFYAGFLALVLILRLLVGLGFQLLIIPGLIAYVLTVLAKPAMIAESLTNPFTALKRGYALVSGRGGWLAGLLVTTLVGVALSMIGFLVVAGTLLALIVPQGAFPVLSMALAALWLSVVMLFEVAMAAALYRAFSDA